MIHSYCDFHGRKINFANSKTLVGVATDRNAGVTLACVSFHYIFPLFLRVFSFFFLFLCVNTMFFSKKSKMQRLPVLILQPQ